MSIFITDSELRQIVSKNLIKEAFGGFGSGVSLDYGKAYSSIMSDTSAGFGNTIVADGVKFGPGKDGELRRAAWLVLSIYLPDGTKLTSCYRTQEDQDRIIKKYANRAKYAGDPNDIDAMHKHAKKNNYIIRRYVGKGHGGNGATGAFDLSGADLDAIWEGVESCGADTDGPYPAAHAVKFLSLKKGSIIERENNAVHVQFKLSDIDLAKCKEIIADQAESESNVASDENQVNSKVSTSSVTNQTKTWIIAPNESGGLLGTKFEMSDGKVFLHVPGKTHFYVKIKEGPPSIDDVKNATYAAVPNKKSFPGKEAIQAILKTSNKPKIG